MKRSAARHLARAKRRAVHHLGSQKKDASIDVLVERSRQRREFEAEHDDARGWMELCRAGCAYGSASFDTPKVYRIARDWQVTPGRPRRRMVQAAALMIAAIEAYDREAEGQT